MISEKDSQKEKLNATEKLSLKKEREREWNEKLSKEKRAE